MTISPIRLIIDCDPAFGVPGADIDDCLAIALALRSPEASVEAVTLVAGNVSLDAGAQSARRLLTLAGRTDIPLHRGAARPLVEPDEAWRSELDGRGGRPTAVRLWSDVERAKNAGASKPAPAAATIVDRVMRAPGTISLVAIGPLTNVAIALSLEPRLAGALKSLIVMGGAVHLPGQRERTELRLRSRGRPYRPDQRRARHCRTNGSDAPDPLAAGGQ